MKKAIISWSGGKDSCYALHKSIENNIKVVALISVMNKQGTFTKSNGVSKEVLSEQAIKLNLPIETISTSWDNYEKNLLQTLVSAKNKYRADCCIFGDIDIEPHRKFEEDISSKAGLNAILPLWGYNRETLADDVIKSGIKAKISVIRKSIMSDKCLGEDYSEKLFPYLIENNIDLLGENGEFHTLVYDSPLFFSRICLKQKNIYNIKDCKSVNYTLVTDNL